MPSPATDRPIDLDLEAMRAVGRRRKDGHRTGLWQWFDDTGKLRAERRYAGGVEHGRCERWYADGSRDTYERWAKGRLTLSERFEGGKVVRRVRDDAKHYVIEVFNRAGLMVERRIWSYRTKRWRTDQWHHSGTRRSQWDADADGNYTNVSWWDGSGRPILSDPPLDSDTGRSVSALTAQDGSRARFSRHNGELHGAVRLTWSNGERRWTGHYRDGKLDGAVTAWYADGTLERSGRFRAGTMQGPWEWYRPDGELVARMNFDESTGIRGIQLRIDGRVRRVSFKRALAICEIDATTGALRLDPLNALTHADHAAMRELAAVENDLVTQAMPTVSLDRPSSGRTFHEDVEVDGADIPLDVRIRRLPCGAIEIRSRLANRGKRWRTALYISANDGHPSLVSGSASPTKRFVALLVDVDQRERTGELIFVDLLTARVVYRAASPGFNFEVGWMSDTTAVFVEAVGGQQQLVVRNVVTGTRIHTLLTGDQIRTSTPESSEATARYLIAHVFRKGSWSCHMFDLHDQSHRPISLDAVGARHHSSAVEQDGWLTMTVDDAFVIGTEIGSGPQNDQWKLLLPSRDTRHVSHATYDGTTLTTHETRDGFLRRVRRRRHRRIDITRSYDKTLHYVTAVDDDVDVVKLDSATARVEQRHVLAPDGTRIPVTTLLPLGRAASHVVLHVYGGYGKLGQLPAVAERSLIDGYAVVIAHVRGGGDRGSRWAAEGTGPNKWNSVADTVAVVDDLVNRYKIHGRLAICGGSHGTWVAVQTAYRRPSSIAIVYGVVPELDLFASTYAPNFAPWGNRFDVEREVMRDFCAYDGMPERIPFDVFLVAAGCDSRVTWHEAVRFVRRARARSVENARALVYVDPDQGHKFESSAAREIATDLMHAAVAQAFARRAE